MRNLYSRRRELELLDAKEAEGQDVWSLVLDEQFRNRLWMLFENATGRPAVGRDTGGTGSTAQVAQRLLMQSLGVQVLVGSAAASDDLGSYLRRCPDDRVPDVIEAMYWAAVEQYAQHVRFGYKVLEPSKLEAQVNDLLYQHRVSWELVEGAMIPRASQELHRAVVVPTLRLLSGRQAFEGAERAYQDALKEMAAGKSADAITDAGTALQETLLALGCDGNSLGSLLASARKKKLIAPHDHPLTTVMVKAVEWAAADRSNLGDAHVTSEAQRDDAWLTVHVVGALILRLAADTERPTP